MKDCHVGICEISLCRLVSYQMLPSVIYQNAKWGSSSQARLSVYVLVLSPTCQPGRIPSSCSADAGIASSFSLFLSFSPHHTLLFSNLHPYVPVPQYLRGSGRFHSDPTTRIHDHLLVVCLVPDAATVVPRCANYLPTLLLFNDFFPLRVPPLVLFASNYFVLSRGSDRNVHERLIRATVSGSVRVGQRSGV